MPENYLLNGDNYTHQEVSSAAEAKGLSVEEYIEKFYPAVEPGKTTDPASNDTDSGSDDGFSVLLDRVEAGDFGEELVDEVATSNELAIKNIPSRQDNNIAAINDRVMLLGKDEENKKELFDQHKLEHGDKSPDQIYVDMYGKDVFMEKSGSADVMYSMPENPTGFLLNDPEFWENSNKRENSRNAYIDNKAKENRVQFENKFALKEEAGGAIVAQGDNYISIEDMDIAELRRDGDIEGANKLAKERGYIQLLAEDGSLKQWIPQDIEEKAQAKGEGTSDKEVLLEERAQAYHRLIAAGKLAHENSQPGTHPYLNTLGDVTLGSSIVGGVKRLFGSESTASDTMEGLAKLNESGELPAGLHKLPSKTATAIAYNNALDEFTVMNRALEINADLSKLQEENFFKEIVAPTNDKVVETFSGMLEANGFEAAPDALKRAPSDFAQENGLNVFGDNTELRDILEGGRDVAKHLAPLAASVYLTKKLPVGKSKDIKNLGQLIDKKTNILGRYLKGAGPQSRVYKNAVDLTLGGIKETLILGAADVPAEKIFGADPFVFNDKTGEFTPTFPFALGFGNAAAAKILKKLTTTKNFFTPALAQISRSGTAQAALEANIGATTGTATMFFAEEVVKGIDGWQNLGYESQDEMKEEHGFKNLVETYIGMLMFQSVSPAMGQNALSKLGTGMRGDVMRATTGLTPRARKAMKFFGIEKNKKGEFNLQEVNNNKAQKIYDIRKDKDLSVEAKEKKIEEIENSAEELIFHNELKLAKELAKKDGKYREYLTNTFDIANKLKSGQKPNASDIQRFSNLTNVEFSFLKKKFNVTENSDFSRMLDNKRDVYKSIVENVNGQRLHQISPEARNKQIELYLGQAEMAGEINMLAKQAETKPHLKEINAAKINKIKEKQKINAEEVVKNEELYDKILKDKFSTEVEFSKLMAKEIGAGFNLLSNDQYNKVEGSKKGAEGHYDRVKNQVYINKDRALEVRQLGTPLHEITHAILRNSLKESYTDDQGVERTRVSKEGMVKINQFLNKLSPKEKAAVEKRMEKQYKYYKDSNGNFILRDGKKIERPKNEYAEEYLTAFGDVLKNKEVVESKDLANRIKDVVYPILQRAGFKNLKSIDTDSGEGLYNMLKALQKGSETQVIDKDILNIVKTSKTVTGKALAESRTITEGMKEASSDIDRIYAEKGMGGYNEIIDRIKGKDAEGRSVSKDFIKQYTEIYREHAKYSEMKSELYDAMANDPTYGVLGSIIKYDVSKGTTMAEHILGRLKQGKHIDVANLILGKDAARQFTKSLDVAEVKEIEADQLSAEEQFDIKEAEAKRAQAPNLRKSLKNGEEKGINQELIDKVENTVIKTFGTKVPLPETKGFKKSLNDSYKTELKKPLADWLGKGPEYEVRLRENFEAIMEHVDPSFFVQMERLTPRNERIFTEVEIESMSSKQTDKAIADGRVPKNTSRTAGNTLWKFKKPAPAQFLKFFTDSKLGSTKGTRKDRLAEILGVEMAKDFTSEVLSRPEVIAKIKRVSEIELEGNAEIVEKAPTPELRAARKARFENYVERVAAEIGKDPNIMFSETEFIKKVNELTNIIELSESIEEVINLKTGEVLKGKYDKEVVAAALYGWGEGWIVTAVNKVGGNKGFAYEVVQGERAVKAAKKVNGLFAELNVTEKKMFLEAVGNFKGGKVQAPDLMVDVFGKQMAWELKFGNAVAGKNNAGFVNFTKGTFERTKTRRVAEHETAVRESLQDAINQAKGLEAVLREKGVLKKGEDFTSKTKIPLDIHNLISGRGGAKAKVKSTSVEVEGDFISDYYNEKGVFYMQMHGKGAMYLGVDPMNVGKELGIPKLEGKFILKTRIFAASYKGKDGKTAGYTYKIIAEPLLSPKSITSKSTFNLDMPGSWKKMMGTGSMQALGKSTRLEATALKANNKIAKKTGVVSESRTNKEAIAKMKIVDKALELGRKRNKKARGMSTFDFDETVGFSNNSVIATKGGKTKKIASDKWPFVGDKLIKEGWKMDFTDFNKVTDGKPGPLMQKMKNQIEKFGPENVFILTARAKESQSAIHEYLKSEGIEIPLKNITGLGNSTGEAKAMWMLEKFSEGYNDMYFVDDAMPNVKAVRDVLNQLDIKSKVQSVYSKTDLNKGVNKVMEHSLDIGSKKVFSKAEAKVRGKDIKRRRVFMRDSAADLELLIEPLYGKGKEGIKNKEWFKEELVMPFERGIRDYNSARQSAKNDYMNLRKQNKDVVKEISKPVEGTAFTNDMAMRVYLWNKAGYKIPDLAKGTEAKLIEHIQNNSKLQAYAENFARITKQEKGLKEPGENWWGETMAGEVTNINRGVSRKQYLQEWIDVKNEIFTEENLNKMESKLGTEWRENITDMFDRMETGRTRSLKMDRGSAAMMNYLNGGIGTIMNFNTRSAVLQTISTTNFLNMRENNPIAAAKAMGNVKQFAKDFKYIMNSDMLKQRRDGLAMNVTEAEIASAAASSQNPVQSIISKVLKAGYLPTKMADSFAISFGGATFYRNRIKMYEKQGMKTKEAESKAFLDFQVIAERTQQSSRADLLSKQQTSLIGRFILPFANTPMQMNRAGMKDILDISKGRFEGGRELSEKIGRISYYMGAQVAIFAGLQSALFAMLLNDDDVSEEKLANTKSMMLNTTADSMLRGFGIQGAVLSATKNAIQEYVKQDSKPGFTADYSEVAEKLLNVSPPIGSKFGMLDRAGDRKKWAKIKKNDEFKFELGNPSLEASLMTVQAVTNAPVYSPYQNLFNMKYALSDQYETWQRMLMASGWTPYSVGIETEEKKKKKSKRKKTSQDIINERRRRFRNR